MEIIKKLLEALLQYLKSTEEQKVQNQEEKRIEIEIKKKTDEIKEKKNNEKINSSDDNFFGD